MGQENQSECSSPCEDDWSQQLMAYRTGERQFDCTSAQVLSREGRLEILKWAYESGYANSFDSSAFGYALHGKQFNVALWMLEEKIICWQDVYIHHNRTELISQGLAIGLKQELLETIQECSCKFGGGCLRYHL